MNDDEFTAALERALGIPQHEAAYAHRAGTWVQALRAFGKDQEAMSALRPVATRIHPSDRGMVGPWVDLMCGRSHIIGRIRITHDGGPDPASSLRLRAGRALAAHLGNAELVGGDSITDSALGVRSLIAQRRRWTCRLETCSWNEPRGYRPEHILDLYQLCLRTGLRRVPLAIERR